MKGRTIRMLGGVGLVGVACGTTRLNAGSNADGGTAEFMGLPYLGTVSNSFEFKCDLPAPDSLAGVWQGEFDTYTLPSGSKAVRIDLSGVSTAGGSPQGLCGTVTLGEGAPPPVATDPKAPPPGLGPHPAPYPIIEGFGYEFVSSPVLTLPLFDGGGDAGPRLDDRRVLFGITRTQIYKSWCNLQLSYPQFDLSTLDRSNPPADLYRCVRRGAYDFDANEPPPDGRWCDFLTARGASCAQAEYCFFDVCECSGPFTLGQGCTVRATAETRFDLSRAGTILTGNAVIDDIVQGLHLTRSTDGGS